MSLALIVLAAKETLEEFANRLCIHGRQGSVRVPNGDKSDPAALWEHYHYRPCSALLSVSAFFLKKTKTKKKETSLPFSVCLTHNVARERSTPGTPGTQLSLYRTSPIFKRRFLVLVKAYFKFATKEFSLK